jgi:hypothetical protein
MITSNYKKKYATKRVTENKEMFFFICSFLQDAGFSSQINLFLWKRRFYRFFTASSNTKSINLKIKLSRSNFKKANNLGVLCGFYRAIW